MFMSTRYKKRDPKWRRRHLFSIEDSLAKLFECLTLEYSCSKLISPKYKQFKSQNIDFEQKTRLNNAIWRAWHIQYKLGKRARFFMFDPPFSDQSVHSTPQAVILEGKYWKKRLDSVSREYKKWRRFYTYKFVSTADSTDNPTENFDNAAEDLDEDSSEERQIITSLYESEDPDLRRDDLEIFFDSFAAASDLPDTLFSSLETQRRPSFAKRKSPLCESSAVIQPTLDMLNPCFDELIESFDWLAPELAFGRTLDPVEENPASEGLEIMNVDESSMLTEETVSGPVSQTAKARELAQRRPSSDEGPPIFEKTYCGDRRLSGGESANQDIPGRFPVQHYQTPSFPTPSCSLPPSDVMSLPKLSNACAREGARAARQDSSHEERGRLTKSNGFDGSVTDLVRQSLQTPSTTGTSSDRHQGEVNSEGKPGGLSYASSMRFSNYSDLPPQLQAPNLVAHLQAALASRDIQKMPRNKSDTQLASLESSESVKSPTNRKTSGSRKEGNVGKSKRAKITRNVSDSNLCQMETESSRASRRQTHRSQSLNNDSSKSLPKNYSDTNLAAMVSVPQHRRILPKNYVTLVPLQTTSVLPKVAAAGNVQCVPIYAGQGPTFVVNPQPPGNNEPGAARLYLPKVTQASCSSFTTVSDLPTKITVSTCASSSSQANVGLIGSNVQPQTRIYQLADDGKNILPFTGLTTALSKSVPPSFPANTIFATPISVTTPSKETPVKQLQSDLVSTQSQAAGSKTTMATQVSPSIVAFSPPNGDSTLAKQDQDLVMPLQGLSDQQLMSLARLLQSRDGQQHQQATIAYLEVLQQMLNNLLVQQQQHMLIAQQERISKTVVSPERNNTLQSTLGLLQKTGTVTVTDKPSLAQTPNEASRLLLEQTTVSVPTEATSSAFVTTSADVVPNVSHAPAPRAGPRIKVTSLASLLQTKPEMHTQLTAMPQCTNQGPNINFQTTATLTRVQNVVVPSNGSTASLPGCVVMNANLCRLPLKSDEQLALGGRLNSVSVAMDMDVPADTARTPRGMMVKEETSAGLSTLEDSSGFQRPINQGSTKEEKKRMSHLSAEKRRRGNIKNSFDLLIQLIPSTQTERGLKASKANMLQKAGDYVVYLHRERDKTKERIDALSREIAELNAAISLCQNQLPASGASVNKKSLDQVQVSFITYVKEKMQADHKYWVFSLMLKPLFDSFNNYVATGTFDEFINSVFRWLEQHCTLPVLRPAVLASLRQLSTSTTILTDPSRLPQLATQASKTEDPTVLKHYTVRESEATPARDVILNQRTDVRDTIETPYAWTVQFGRLLPAAEHQDPT